MLISYDVNTNIVNGGRTCTHSWSLHEDLLRKTWRISCSRYFFWEQIEGCSGKFMSAPVDAAIPRDTLVEAGVVVWIGNKCARIVAVSTREYI
jgi:hypothetical protein